MARKRNNAQKIFIETSVFIRFLTHDDPVKYEHCKLLFEQVEAGTLRPYVSNVVILEIVFVLTRLYKFEHDVVHEAIQKLLTLRNITVIEKTNTNQALQYWNSHNIKYGDCLIASQVPTGVTLVTYDSDFEKFLNIEIVTPDKLH